MTSARVILTSAPTPETVARARVLLTFAALCAVGGAATMRGEYDPADVRPVDAAEAHMVAAAIRTAGGACDVVPA